MAVSQPRPPDRVDAALEKVAPLRYLGAHEYARTERVLTLNYNKKLFYTSFLSYKVRLRSNIEDLNVLLQRIKRYVEFCLV